MVKKSMKIKNKAFFIKTNEIIKKKEKKHYNLI